MCFLCLCVEWSREMLLEALIDDPVACCEKSGVVPPSTVMPDHSLQPHDTDAGSAFSLPLPLPQFVVSCFCKAFVCLCRLFTQCCSIAKSVGCFQRQYEVRQT